MMALSVAYQQERPNVEAADMTALVIRALGLIVGRAMKADAAVAAIADNAAVLRREHFISTTTITNAAHALVEVHELDINPEIINTRRIGHVLKKMRLEKVRQGHTSKRGWNVLGYDVMKWVKRYGLEQDEVIDFKLLTLPQNGGNGGNGSNDGSTQPAHNTLFGGKL